jgi:hypothetical protein
MLTPLSTFPAKRRTAALRMPDGNTLLAVAGFAIMALPVMSASNPLITISSLPAEGVILVGSSSPQFATAFKSTRAQGYDALLPYTVVIQNNTDQEIVAYSVA